MNETPLFKTRPPTSQRRTTWRKEWGKAVIEGFFKICLMLSAASQWVTQWMQTHMSLLCVCSYVVSLFLSLLLLFIDLF